MTTDIIKAILLEQIPSQGRATAFYDFLNQTQVTDYDFLLQLSGAPRKLGRKSCPILLSSSSNSMSLNLP